MPSEPKRKSLTREEIIDKAKLVFFVVLFVVCPVIFFIATADGNQRSGDRYDYIRR